MVQRRLLACLLRHSLILLLLVGLILPTGAASGGSPPPEPDWIPPNLDATPASQSVTSVDGYKAEWNVCIYEGVGTYTLEVWYGEGSYLKRVGLSASTCYPYHFYYDHVSNGTYNQTWKISGQGGPDYDYTSITKQ